MKETSSIQGPKFCSTKLGGLARFAAWRIASFYGRIINGIKYFNGNGANQKSRQEEMDEKRYPVVSSPRDPRFLSLRSLQTYQGR